MAMAMVLVSERALWSSRPWLEICARYSSPFRYSDPLRTEARIEGDMDPFVAAKQLDTDEIVELGELRAYLAALVEMSYQNTGYRRVKNPRIWSMHDLRELVGGPR